MLSESKFFTDRLLCLDGVFSPFTEYLLCLDPDVSDRFNFFTLTFLLPALEASESTLDAESDSVELLLLWEDSSELILLTRDERLDLIDLLRPVVLATLERALDKASSLMSWMMSLEVRRLLLVSCGLGLGLGLGVFLML